MTAQTTTYSTGGGPTTYTAPSTLVGGSVVITVEAPAGQSTGTASGGKGGKVVGTVAIAPSGTLSVYVGDNATNGFHLGGFGGDSSGGRGGGSSAVLSGATVLLEAGGGGGGGGQWLHQGNGGGGGMGGLSPTSGGAGNSNTNSAQVGTGPFGAGAGGGGGNQGAGGTGTAATDNSAGGVAPGGGGKGGTNTGTPKGGGGGAGGRSHADASVSSVVYTDATWTPNTGQVVIVAHIADAPLAPVLTSPVNGASADTNAAGVTFGWTYKPATDSGSQTAYALRVSTDGAAYQYWNASSALFQGTIVWNPTAATTAAIPAAKLADGHTYTWSVATQEAHYSLQGPFASDFTLVASAQPTVTVTAPGGTVTTATPVVQWTEVLGGGLSQTSYRVAIYTQAQTVAPGFAPGVTTAVVDSGVVSSAALSYNVVSQLAQGNWVAYVQVVETGSISSAWASSSFTIAYPGPATPTLTATPGFDPTTAAPIATLVATAQDNLLSTDDASFETTIGTWVAAANCAVARSTAQSQDGAASLSLTSTAAGTMSAQTATGVAGYAVTGGNSYSAVASFRSAVSARACSVGIAWYTAAGALISTSTGSTVNDTTSGWTRATVAAVAPGTAAFATTVATVAATGAASEVHFVDEAGLFNLATPPAAWTRGGLVGISSMTLNYSDDGGTTWFAVRGSPIAIPANTQQVTVVDPEIPNGTTRTYQAIVSANVTSPFTATVTSTPVTATALVTSNNFWVTDPTDQTTALALHRTGSTASGGSTLQNPISFATNTSEQMGVFRALGRTTAIAQRGVVQSPEFVLNALMLGAAEIATFENLRNRGVTLLVRTDMGHNYYVAMGPDLPEATLRATDRITNPYTVVSVLCTVVDRP